MYLDNYCIDERETNVARSLLEDGRNIQRSINVDYFSQNSSRSQTQNTNGNDIGTIVAVNDGVPSELLGGGHHFNDAPDHRREYRNVSICPMDNMFQTVIRQNLQRPTPQSRQYNKK